LTYCTAAWQSRYSRQPQSRPAVHQPARGRRAGGSCCGRLRDRCGARLPGVHML